MNTYVRHAHGLTHHLREEVEKDLAHWEEVVERDCYKMLKLRDEGFKPKLIFDGGPAFGDFAGMCAQIWPDAKIVSFDIELGLRDIYAMNAPRGVFVHGYLGAKHSRKIHNRFIPSPQHIGVCANGFTGWDGVDYICIEDVIKEFGTPDIFKMDIEGGEADVLQGLYTMGALKDIEYVAGEWHFPPSLGKCMYLLQSTHDFTYEGDWYNGCRWETFHARKNA